MTNKSDGSTAANILRAAIGHMEQRAATYDKPEGERSMGATVEAFRAVTGVSMTEEQGWLFMALLKSVRSQQGAYRADSYEDGAAYFALAGEAAVRDRNGGWTTEAIKASALTANFGQQHTFEPVAASDPLACSGCVSGCFRCRSVEPASLIDDESPRMQAIGQNGNDGAAYSEIDRLRAAEALNAEPPVTVEEAIALGAVPQREPCQPRHRCLACAGGHSTHECGAGL